MDYLASRKGEALAIERLADTLHSVSDVLDLLESDEKGRLVNHLACRVLNRLFKVDEDN